MSSSNNNFINNNNNTQQLQGRSQNNSNSTIHSRNESRNSQQLTGENNNNNNSPLFGGPYSPRNNTSSEQFSHRRTQSNTNGGNERKTASTINSDDGRYNGTSMDRKSRQETIDRKSRTETGMMEPVESSSSPKPTNIIQNESTIANDTKRNELIQRLIKSMEKFETDTVEKLVIQLESGNVDLLNGNINNNEQKYEETIPGVKQTDDPEMEKFKKMLKNGLPQGAVENAMIRAELDPEILFEKTINAVPLIIKQKKSNIDAKSRAKSLRTQISEKNLNQPRLSIKAGGVKPPRSIMDEMAERLKGMKRASSRSFTNFILSGRFSPVHQQDNRNQKKNNPVNHVATTTTFKSMPLDTPPTESIPEPSFHY